MRSAALRLAAQLADEDEALTPHKETVEVDGILIHISFTEATGETRLEGPQLRAIETAILTNALDWIVVKALARVCQYEYGPYFRQAIADLLLAGRLERSPRGVRTIKDTSNGQL
jgi:hypothetical protein